MNITDLIWRNARTFPQRQALVYDGQTASYRELTEAAERVAARFAVAGIRRGDCVALSTRNPATYLTMVLALARMGAISTPFPTESPQSAITELLRRHSVVAVVQGAANPWRCEALPQLRYVDIQGLFASAPDQPLAAVPVADDVDDKPWHFALSSGTTGVPKSMPKTHLSQNVEFMLASRSLLQSEERVLVFIALGVNQGLKSSMRALMVGATLVLTQNPAAENFFGLVQRERPQRVVTSTALAGRMVAYAAQNLPNSRELCASVKTLVVAGSAAPPALRAGIEQFICPELEINYGSTEIGSMAVANRQTLNDRPESAGRLYPWIYAQSVDDSDVPLPAGTQGILRFKSCVMPDAYWNDEEATARVFRHGWFYPGDTGSIDSAGYVTLAGRVDHVLNLGGVKLDPVLVEQVLNSHPAIFESAVIAAALAEASKPVLVALVVTRMPFDVQEMKQFCRERLTAQFVPEFFAAVKELPKNTAGKIRRTELSASVRLNAGTSQQA
jgi:acyl-coenzyme A synthetase/AMP-(fatty) acid ligase